MTDHAARPGSPSEQRRLAALIDANILDTPPEGPFDDIVAIAGAICDVPIALVSLVDRDRQWFKAKTGVNVTQTHVDTSVCALAIEQDALFVIPDLAIDPRTRHFSLVTQPPHIRFYAGYPIVTAGGHPLGSLCAIDVIPRPEGLTDRQALALEALARQVAIEIERGAAGRPPAIPFGGAPSIGMWDWDVQNDLVRADEGFAALFGVDPARAAQGAPIAAFFDGVHPDDVEQVRAAVDRAITTGETYDTQYRVIGPDGHWRWMASRGQCEMAPDGTPLRFPGASFDIHARKSAELRLAALLELGDRLGASGDAGDLAYAAAEVLGRSLGASRAGYGVVDPAAETIRPEREWAAPGISTYPGTLHFRDYGSFIDDLQAGEAVVIADVDEDPRTRGVAHMPKSLQVHALINLPLIENGQFVALLFVNQDRPRAWSREEIDFVREVAERTRFAVERRRAEQELATLNSSLEAQVEARTRDLLLAEDSLRQAQKMEAVGQLTGGLAHDFNNLLTGISGAIEMMQARIAQGRAGELDRYITAAQGAARRAAALTHRLLAFSRRQTLDPKPVDVNRLIAGIEELVCRTVGPAIQVEVVGAMGLWPAMVDPNQLENAVLNLCINARDAMPEGGQLIIQTLNLELDEEAAAPLELAPGPYVRLSVQDTGTGMSAEVMERVFEPFFTTKPIGQGTGLGLSMIYGFMRQSGGQVRMASRLGHGTTMQLLLPRLAGAEDAATADSAEPPALDPYARGEVLLVEDEAPVRALIAEALAEVGCRVTAVADGHAALEYLRGDAPIDLLLTDVGLPGGLNGRQVADAGRQLRPGLRVLFITGYAANAAVGAGQLDAGMEVMTKPFQAAELARRVQAILAPRG